MSLVRKGGISTVSDGDLTQAAAVNAGTGNVTATNYDAGSSGVAGTVDVFPSTALSGKLSIAAADNAGDTTTTLTNASMAGTRTITLTDPVATASNLHPHAIQAVSTDTAITIKNGTVLITKGSAAAVTLAAPTATVDDGKILNIVSTTAQTHGVVNASPGFNNGGSGKDTGTFGGAIGDGFEVVAYQGAWYVLNSVNVTLG